MVDQIAVVSKVIPAGTPTYTVDFTHSDITETFSAAIFIFSGYTNDTVDNTHALLGIGFCAPDAGAQEEEAICSSAEDGLAGSTTDTASLQLAVASAVPSCIGIQDPTAAAAAVVAFLASYNSSIAGGVRLNVTTNIGNAFTVKVTAILFAGLSRAYAGEASSTTVSSSEGVGGTTDFEPDLAIFSASSAALNAGQNDAIPNLGFGLNKTGLPQICAYIRWNDNQATSDADGFVRSANCYGNIPQGADTENHVSITAYTSTGWDFISDAGATTSAHYLALKFSGFHRKACANLAVTAATGDKTFTDFGFTPGLVLGMSHLLSTIDGAVQDGSLAGACGFFITGGKGSRSHTICLSEGVPQANPKIARSRQEDVGVLNYEHNGTVTQRATWAGPSGSTGFKLNFSVAGTAGFLTALGIALGHTDNDTEDITEGAVFRAVQDSAVAANTEDILDGHVFMVTAPFTSQETEDILDEAVLLLEVAVPTILGDFAGESYSAGSRRGRIATAGSTAGIVL